MKLGTLKDKPLELSKSVLWFKTCGNEASFFVWSDIFSNATRPQKHQENISHLLGKQTKFC